MRECSRCLVKETADTISFDADGACSVCVQVENKLTKVDWAAKRADLDVIAASARARGGNYDLIVPFSGGKDSTFQLLYVVRELKLKPLVVRFNHLTMRPQVEINNERTFRILGVDVVDFRPNWRVVKELIREALIRRGDGCWYCHTGVYSFPMHVALQYRIPLIMWGETLNEYQSFGLGDGEKVDELRFNRAMNLGMTADDMFQYLEGRVDRRDLWQYAYPPKTDLDSLGVQSICLGSFIEWRTKQQVARIKDELGWEGAPVEGIPPLYDYEKIECKQQGVRDWLKYLKRGFGRTNHLVNIDIRHGEMDRETGAALARKYDGVEPASLGWWLAQIGLSRDEFYEIAASHVVDPWEFPDFTMDAAGKPLPDMPQW